MKIGVPRETADGERRVALVPDSVRSLAGREGVEVLVESSAGLEAGHDDEAYVEAGARIADRDEVLGAELVVGVAQPEISTIEKMYRGQALIAHLSPWTAADSNRALAEAGVTAFAMEAIPRTTRAQAMDALSSQASVAGYSATMIAATESERFWGMLTTAAGTIRPAKVLVLGAGVAGLQAIATARKLGAIVTGFDIRRAAWEQIASLGGRPLELDFIPDAEGEGGYARPLTDEENEKVRQAIGENAARQDVVITTAAIPGRPAPILITAEAVSGMAPGSVIVDLAAETGGNCEVTEPGRTVVVDGVKVVGPSDLPSDLPGHASQLYSKNVENLLDLMIDDSGNLAVNFDDDILDAACIAAEGETRGERTAR